MLQWVAAAVSYPLVGPSALGGRLEVILLEVMQHATDSLDQLIVGRLVLTGISEEFRQLVPKMLGRVRVAASQVFPDGPRVAVGATDPLTFAGVALVLAVVALAATYVPALRAARIDPVLAIQGESQ